MLAHLFFKIKTYLNYHLRAVNAQGLHSPFLFDFYNEVIVAKKMFYSFKKIKKIAYNSSNSISNLFFLFRCIHFFAPKTVFIDQYNFPISFILSMSSLQKKIYLKSLKYLKKNEMSIFRTENVYLEKGNSADLGYFSQIHDSLQSKLALFTYVIIESPHKNKLKEEKWKKLCNDTRISISIDLFKFGILILNRNKAKEHFILNM